MHASASGARPEQEQRIAHQASAWAATHGLLYINPQSTSLDTDLAYKEEPLSWSHAPIAALPNTFPGDVFDYLLGKETNRAI